MGTFTISLPSTDQEVIERVAKAEMRSRRKQIQLIIKEWVRTQAASAITHSAIAQEDRK